MLPILKVPHQVLRANSKDVVFDQDTRLKAIELIDTIKNAKNPEGVGLSFPQIGYSLRGFVTYLEHKVRLYLNPIILDQDEKLIFGGTSERPTLEGCLSIPHLYGPVKRSKKIKIRAYDEFGNEFDKTLSSFPARVFLHEYDHLEGVLFTDYTLRDKLPLYFLDQDRNEFVEIKEPASVIKW